eukprot:CAMPEP_0117435318 /NCGR_PEP_ID=MMETSP0759-20121206/418_1 /TAXON_ID=63605 /ORGANISM="Percolomonas cosmopolitus, Strain WS" /LENGTH=113 /DNA_ID=CAMNT_0005226859 /DNA_START=1729 /DNA_END=2067 /DNA_ORIENTATION=+
MLPPKHLYSAAIINKHSKPQAVHVVYRSEGQDDIVEKQIIKPNEHHVFTQKTFTRPDDTASYTYAIENIEVPEFHEIKGPFVEGPTKLKAFELIGDDKEGSVSIKESNEVRVW